MGRRYADREDSQDAFFVPIAPEALLPLDQYCRKIAHKSLPAYLANALKVQKRYLAACHDQMRDDQDLAARDFELQADQAQAIVGDVLKSLTRRLKKSQDEENPPVCEGIVRQLTN